LEDTGRPRDTGDEEFRRLTGKRRDQLNGSAIAEFRVRCAEAKIGSTEPVQSLFR
jgi:hypothetical protein